MKYLSMSGNTLFDLLHGIIKSITTSTIAILLAFIANITVAYAEKDPAICTRITDVPHAECEALVALYQNTAGDDWKSNSGWLENTQVGTWFGVTVQNSAVFKLTLYDNQLTGIIPSELEYLTQLEGLYLHHNKLTGKIPKALGNLFNLRNLFLDFNNLTGSIPVELGLLNNLEILYLAGNNLDGQIPTALRSLSKLQYLFLEYNNLTGSIPIALSELTHLHILSVHNNNLTGSIPAELGKLKDLWYLFLSFNDLNGYIPAELSGAVNMLSMDLDNNQLTGSIPATLGELKNLGALSLWNNNLSGSIPAELGNLTKLQHFSVANNNLNSSIPLTFIQLNSLSSFDYSQTNLCAPTDEDYMNWEQSISALTTSGIICSPTVPLTANNDYYSMIENKTFTTTPITGVLNNDQGNGVLHSVLLSTTQHGALYLNEDGSFQYTPDACFTGIDVFTYHIMDENHEFSNEAIVSIEITAHLNELGFNPLSNISIGTGVSPSFADLDADGDLDALIGNHAGEFQYFVNAGNARCPMYIQLSANNNPLNHYIINSGNSTPDFIDMDADGDFDMYSGSSNGDISFFENSSDNNLISFTLVTDRFSNLLDQSTHDSWSKPRFVNLDGDSDQDATIGGEYGLITYYENINNQRFVLRNTIGNPFKKFEEKNKVSAPTFGDLNGDGSIDMLVGDNLGYLNYYENQGSKIKPSFNFNTDNIPSLNYDLGSEANPMLIDIDADHDLDIFVGVQTGEIIFFENVGNVTTPIFKRQDIVN